jgi:hypothetical protein
MIPTNVQCAQRRKEFEKTEWYAELKRDPSGYYSNKYIEGVWQGYLRRCTEQLQGLYPVGEKVVEVVAPAVEDEPIVVGFNYILTAIRINVAVQFYNTTFDCWTDLSGTSAEIRQRDYHSINRHFGGLDWRIKPTSTAA